MKKDIPQDLYFLLMTDCETNNYTTIRQQVTKSKNVRIETLRAVATTDSFELARIQTTIRSTKSKCIYNEEYTVECIIAGMPICKNTFTTQSPTQFGSWCPTEPNLQKLYHILKKNVQLDSDYMSPHVLITRRLIHRFYKSVNR